MLQIRNDSPCDRDCPERSPTCHGSCERYAVYDRERKQRREKQWRQSIWTKAKTGAFCKSGPGFQKK